MEKHRILTTRPPKIPPKDTLSENSGVRCKKDSWGIQATEPSDLGHHFVSIFEWKSWINSSVRLELTSFPPLSLSFHSDPGIFRITYVVPSPIISSSFSCAVSDWTDSPMKPETFRLDTWLDQRCPRGSACPSLALALVLGRLTSNPTF